MFLFSVYTIIKSNPSLCVFVFCQVRSITLDTWEPEQLKVMLELGNAVVNGIYEGAVDESIAVRAKPDSNRFGKCDGMTFCASLNVF